MTDGTCSYKVGFWELAPGSLPTRAFIGTPHDDDVRYTEAPWTKKSILCSAEDIDEWRGKNRGPLT